MESLEIQVQLIRTEFDRVLGTIKTDLRDLQGDINRMVASMKATGGTAGRSSGGGGSNGQGKGEKKSIEDMTAVMETAKRVTLEYNAASSTLAKTQAEVAAATKATRVALKGGTQEQQDYVASLSRAVSSTNASQKQQEQAQKQALRTEREIAKQRIAASEAVVVQRRQLDRDSEQSQIVAARRQAKVAEDAGKQALAVADLVNKQLLDQQIAAAEERAKAYYGRSGEIKKAQSDAIADQTRDAQRSIAIDKEKQQGFIQNARAEADQYRQHIKSLAQADERRIDESRKVVRQKEQLDREYEQSQQVSANRQAKIIEDAGKQALAKSKQVNENLLRDQVATASQGAKAYQEANQRKIANDNDYYAEQKRAADKFRNDQKNAEISLGKELQGVTEQYRQQARPVRQTPEQRAVVRAETNLAALQQQNRLLVEARKNGLGLADAMAFARRETEAAAAPTAKLASQIRAAHIESEKVHKSFNGMFGAITSFLLRFTAFTLAAGILTRGFFAIENALAGLVSKGFEFNSFLESSVSNIATILAGTRNYVDAQGQAVTAAQALPFIFEQAAEQQKRLFDDSLKSKATFEEISGIYQQILVHVGDQKASQEDLLQLARAFADISVSAGERGQKAVVNARQFLEANRAVGNTIKDYLRLSLGQTKDLKEQKDLVQETLKRYREIKPVLEAQATTWEIITSTASNLKDALSAGVFKSEFEGIKTILLGFNERLLEIYSIGGLSGALGIEEAELKQMGRDLAEITVETIKFLRALVDIGLQASSFVGLKTALASVGVVIGILAGLLTIKLISALTGAVTQTYALATAFLFTARTAIVSFISGVISVGTYLGGTFITLLGLARTAVLALTAAMLTNPWTAAAVGITIAGVALYKYLTSAKESENATNGETSALDANTAAREKNNAALAAKPLSAHGNTGPIFPDLGIRDAGAKPVEEEENGKAAKAAQKLQDIREDIEATIDRINEQSARASRQVEQIISDLGSDPMALQEARLQEVNAAIQSDISAIKKRRTITAEELRALENLQIVEARKAVLESLKDFEDAENKKTEILKNAAETRNSIAKNELEIQSDINAQRSDNMQTELDILQNQSNRNIPREVSLIQQIGDLEQERLRISREQLGVDADRLKTVIAIEKASIDRKREDQNSVINDFTQLGGDKNQAGRLRQALELGLEGQLDGVRKLESELAVLQARMGLVGDVSANAFKKTAEEVKKLTTTIIDLNNPIANAFGNLFESLQRGGKGLKNVFKTLQKDIQQSFADAFRESIKKKLQFDVEFKGNIFDLGRFFKDTFSDAVSYVGGLFGGAGGTGGGGFFNGLANFFGGGSATGGASSSSGGGGFLSDFFGGSAIAGNNMVGAGWQLAGAGTYAGIPASGASTLFGNGSSSLGSAFGFGSGGGYAGSGVLNSAGGLVSSAQNISNIAKIASLFSSSGSGGGWLSILGNIGSIISVGKLLSGGLGGIFSGAGGLAAGAGWQLAGAGTYAGIPSVISGQGGLGNVVTNGGFGFGNLANAGGGLVGGLIGSYIGNYINKTFGIGQTKQGQTGSMIGGVVGGIGGGIAGGALTGAALGSVVPVLGTAIGAAIGALLGVIGGGALGDLFAPGRIKTEKAGINKFLNKATDDIKFKELPENKAAAGFEAFKGPTSAAALALGSEFATEAKGGNAGTIVRFAGQGLGNFKRLGLDAEEARERILELAESMGFDIKSGIEALDDNVNKGVLSIGEFKEELSEAKKNLKEYGDTSNLTAKELSDLATANGNTGSRLVTVNEIIAGTIDIYAEFDEFVNGAAIANEYLAESFVDTAKATGLFNSDIQSLSDKIGDGTLSLEEATIELNKFRKEAGLTALDLKDFKISAKEIQEIVDIIKAAMQTLRDAVKGGLTTSITVKDFDRADVEKNIRKVVYQSMADAVAEGMIDGIIKASLASGPISKAFVTINDLTSKFIAGDITESELFAGLDTAFTDVGPAVDKLATAVGLTSERFRQMLADAGILPHLLDDAAASAGGLADAIRNGIDAGVKGASTADIADQFRQNIYTSIYESVLSGFTNGFIEAAAFSGPIGDAMDDIAQLNQDFLAGTITQAEYLAGIRDRFAEIKPIIETIAAATGIASEELRQMLADAGILPDLLGESVGVLGDIAQAASSAIKGGIRMVDFDKADVEKSFRRAIYGTLVDTIVDGFIDGFIKATLATGPLEAAMKNIKGLIDRFVSGDISFDEFGQLLSGELGEIAPLIERIAAAVGLTTEALREILDAAGILPDILDEASGNAADLAKELRKAAKDLLLDSSLSPLKPKERVAEAQANFEDLRRRALAGDEEAARLLPEAARQFLEEARKVFASSAQYEVIFDFVRGTLLEVADKFGPLEDTEEKQLRTLEDVRAYLKTIDINLAKLSGGDSANLPDPNKPGRNADPNDGRAGDRLYDPNRPGRNTSLNDGREGDRLWHGMNPQDQQRSNNPNDGRSGDRLYDALNPGRNNNPNDGRAGDRLYDALNQGRNGGLNDGKAGDRLYNDLNMGRNGELGATNTILQDTQNLLESTLDELGLAATDSEREAAEFKVINVAQLLALQTMSETLFSVDKTLKKIGGISEEQLNNEADNTGRKNEDPANNFQLGRFTNNTDQFSGDRLYSALNPNTLPNSNATDVGLLLLNMSEELGKLVNLSLGSNADETLLAIKIVLDKSYEWLVFATTNIYAAARNSMNLLSQIAKRPPGTLPWPELAEGGVITGKEVPALLHGPEVVIPLEKSRFNKFIQSNNVLPIIQQMMSETQVDKFEKMPVRSFANGGIIGEVPTSVFSYRPESVTPLPHRTNSNITISSPELIEEVRGLRSELRNSNRNDSDQRPIVVQGDFNVGQVKLGEFVQKTVQTALNNQQIRVPQKSVQR